LNISLLSQMLLYGWTAFEFLIAAAFHESNWPIDAVMIVPVTAALLYKIHIENAAMRHALGDEDVSYSSATNRLTPSLI
jgi:hypothetical protein